MNRIMSSGDAYHPPEASIMGSSNGGKTLIVPAM